MIDLYSSLPELARPLLARPRLVHVAIRTKRGPHVTPELFTYFGGALWIATARRTLKARVLDSGDRVSVLLRHGARSLVVEGDVDMLDPFSPRDALKAWRSAVLAPLAMASFGRRNLAHLMGLFADPRALPHSLDTFRVPIAIRPRRAILLEGWRVATTVGRWSQSRDAVGSPQEGDIGELPSSFARMAEGTFADAVLGLESNDLVFPLPAMWDGGKAIASVPSGLMSLIDAGERARACVALEHSAGEAIDDKEGMLLRGDAIVSTDGVVTEVALTVDRATHWEGVETESVSAV